MDDVTAFERQVADEIFRIVGPPRRVDDLAVYKAVTTTRSPRLTLPSMFGAMKYVVAGVIVALFGGILMTGQELATAIQYGGERGPKLRIVLSDNGVYGTIRSHQERHYPARVSGTDLVNPDFTLWGKSFGAHVVTIELGDDVGAKIAEAIGHDGPVLIHVKSSREALSAYSTISKLRGKD